MLLRYSMNTLFPNFGKKVSVFFKTSMNTEWKRAYIFRDRVRLT